MDDVMTVALEHVCALPRAGIFIKTNKKTLPNDKKGSIHTEQTAANVSSVSLSIREDDAAFRLVVDCEQLNHNLGMYFREWLCFSYITKLQQGSSCRFTSPVCQNNVQFIVEVIGFHALPRLLKPPLVDGGADLIDSVIS